LARPTKADIIRATPLEGSKMAALRDPQVAEMLVLSLVLLLFVGSLFSLAVGAGLVLRGDTVIRLFGTMNRWVSTRVALKLFEVPRSSELPVSYQKRRWIAGVVFLVGGAYAAYVLAVRVDVLKLIWVLGVYGASASIALILVDTLRWFLIVGCAAAAVLGVMLLAFPRAWAALEVRANYWYSTRQMVSGGDDMHLTLDRWVARFPRAAGAIIIVLAMIPTVTSSILLFARR
jgi:hypothetical protein